MTVGRRRWRGSRQPDVLSVLAAARPAELDPASARPPSWPGAQDFIDAANFTDLTGGGEPASSPSFRLDPGSREARGRPLGGGRRMDPDGQARSWHRPAHRKLLAAVSCAAATAAIILAISIGATPGTRPSGTPPQPDNESGRVVFHDLPLLGHWRGHVRYGLRDGVVYLAGTAGQSSCHGTSITTLPPQARPDRQLVIKAYLGHGRLGRIDLTPEGTLSVLPGANPCGFVSLDGVSFPLGS